MEHNRCAWAKDAYDIAYHDKEWCKPSHDDAYLFEMLVLEGMQAGLSWNCILKKRENYRIAFDGFDYHKIQHYDETKFQELLENAGIIRNRLKIRSIITNAKLFIDIQQEFGSFSTYIWNYVDGKQSDHALSSMKDMIVTDATSDAISKDLKKRGFKFVGSTIIYSYMQAIGMVNDHCIECDEYIPSKQ